MNITVRVFTGRMIITILDGFHEVELYDPEKKLTKGYAYIMGDYVMVYHGKKEKFDKNELEPGIYTNSLGEYEFIHPSNPTEKDLYHIDHIIELDVNRIFDEISKKQDDFIDPADIEVINNNAEAFTPTFKEDDDFLKYIIKKVIYDKKVNLKNYRHKFPNQYALNNMKSVLNKKTKMTVTNFKAWCEILGIRWSMVIQDDGTDKISPLPNDVEVESENF